MILLLQLLSCWFLCGLIWVVQLVHYPSFRFASESRFRELHDFHSRSITWIVAPAMTIEILTAGALWWIHGGPWWLLNLASAASLWALTALVSVPIHHTLASGKNEAAIERLVATNWARTALWSIRGLALAGIWLYQN